MTVNEFKAWFEGYTEGIREIPNKKQWARIVERVSEIDASSNCYHYHYRDTAPWRPWWPTWYSNTGGTLSTTTASNATNSVATYRVGSSPVVEGPDPEMIPSAAWSFAREIGEQEAQRDTVDA